MKMNSISNKLLIIIVFVNETCDEDNDTVSIINHIDVQKYSNNSEYICEEMISRETLVVFAESSRFVKSRSERFPSFSIRLFVPFTRFIRKIFRFHPIMRGTLLITRRNLHADIEKSLERMLEIFEGMSRSPLATSLAKSFRNKRLLK